MGKLLKHLRFQLFPMILFPPPSPSEIRLTLDHTNIAFSVALIPMTEFGPMFAIIPLAITSPTQIIPKADVSFEKRGA